MDSSISDASGSAQPPPPIDEALTHVVDDRDDAEQAVFWAAEQMLAGQSAEQAAASLLAAGWPSEKADQLAELARQRTRAERGVITRADIAAMEARKYRAAWRFNLFTAFPAWSSAYRLLTSLLHWRHMSRVRRGSHAEQQAHLVEAPETAPEFRPSPAPSPSSLGAPESPEIEQLTASPDV